jgi:hypothetical protein
MSDEEECMDNHLDDDARSRMLCYLVVAQLISQARTKQWLRTDHLVESMQIWLQGQRGECSVFERVQLGHLSLTLAETCLTVQGLRDIRILSRMFSVEWQLNYGSAVTQRLLDICKLRLMGNACRPPAPTPSRPRERYAELAPTRYSHAIPIEAAVRATRRAQGKRNPEDISLGSPEWDEVLGEFLVDVARAKGFSG